MVRQGLVAGLGSDERVRVVAAVGSLGAFRAGRDLWKPHVVVADYELPDGLGVELADQGDRDQNGYEVLIISGADHQRVLDEAVRAGCSGFLPKTAPIEDLVDAIVRVAAGEVVLDDRTTAPVAPDRTEPGATLTSREQEVLELLAATMSAAQISQHLQISPHTVRNHIRSILAKLHAHTQLEAVLNAQQAGLIDPGRSSGGTRQ